MDGTNAETNGQHKKKEGMTDLFLEIENERLEGDAEDNASLVFDIMVSCDHSVYFDNCLIRLSYNTGAFGSDIKENGNIAITRAPAFNTPSYYDPDTMQADIENGLVAIPFGADFNQHPVYNRTLITPTPALLMTIALDIKNCNRNTGIEYTDISLCNIFSSYTVNPGDTLPNVHSFDTTCYRGSITGKTCVPEITGFTNNVPAGLNKTITVDGKILDPFMTIEGNYFGSQQHTGTLFFKDANQIDAYPVDEDFNPISIDNYDIDSWNDDEIILKLPSIINGLTRDQQNPVPGSGEFKVMNFAGYEHEASGLEIPYALTQVLDKDTINNSLLQKANVYLSNQNDSGGYTISFDQSVEDFSPLAKQAATRAIHDWKCATLVNWEIGEDNLSNSTGDGICTISASAMGGGSILQITSPEIIKCFSTYPRTFFLKEFNIEINTDINWQIDTTVEDNLRINKFDFYSTIAHELGHGHMLEHVKEGSNIMYHEGDMGYIRSPPDGMRFA